MSAGLDSSGRYPAAFTMAGVSSFTEFLGRSAPELLPGRRSLPPGLATDVAPHATTIIAVSCAEGVVMAGDRRATRGNLIASRDIEKVHAADEFSLIGIAGTAGVGIELMRLFQVELEHYEKIEGAPLSLVGKANRLATMIRLNLGLAMQGLVVVPLFAGWDELTEEGRIFSYDATGGRYEEHAYFSVGSGSVFARGSLKKLYRPDFNADEAALAVIQALYDAADDDSATGGPDMQRKIFPVVLAATADGVRKMSEEETTEMITRLMASRTERPDGPGAPLA